MSVNLSPLWGAGAQLFDNNGNVLSGGQIYKNAAFASAAAGVLNPNTDQAGGFNEGTA